MNSVTLALIFVSLIAHGLLLGYALLRRDHVRGGGVWLTFTVMLSLIVSLSLSPALLPVSTFAQATFFLLYGALIVRDLTERVPRAWFAYGALWLIGMFAAALSSGFHGEAWLLRALTPPLQAHALIMATGGLVSSVLLVGVTFYAFYVARLSEVANRALFWVIDAALTIIGLILIGRGSDVLALSGALIVLLGTAGAVYAHMSFKVLDVRREGVRTFRTFINFALTAAVILVALIVARGIADTTNLLYLLVVAGVAALLYLPARFIADNLFRWLVRGRSADPAEITRRYTERISSAVELPALVDAATRALNDLLRLRRSALLLVSDSTHADADGGAEVVLLGSDRPLRGLLTKAGELYAHFAKTGAALSQFDLEFDPRYKTLPDIAYFRETGMSAYAPILIDGSLIGILAGGAKLDDTPFTPRDFELLATLAHQTGTVLRNARLVADLRTLNQGMHTLNASLETARDQVQKLDEVKTDFITIASHELRTPLAQIRGYTDIIDALNENGALDEHQIAGMVANLRKASERMEELIAAMLDVSQLDVNAMDLHFTQTSLESAMRMAIEPLTDAIKQRKLTLAARGLRGLPIIQADVQRLVQAFRNVVVNAIKYTPDGGKIDITASLQPAQAPGAPDHVLITIRDTGVGIDRDNLELIFRKFYRGYDPGLHSSGTYKFMGAGPGLGLTIAQGVIEGHGGRIWADSPGHDLTNCPGSTFHILLPVTPPGDARRVMPFHIPEAVSKEPTRARP